MCVTQSQIFASKITPFSANRLSYNWNGISSLYESDTDTRRHLNDFLKS